MNPRDSSPESLAERLQRLEDLQAIHQLFVDYGRHLDAGDVDAYASLFADDGEVLLGPLGRAKGRAAIRELMARVIGNQRSPSYHIVSSPQVALDGDRATSSVMWSVVAQTEDGSTALTMVGRHVDELRRERGAWRFARRKGYVDLPRQLPRAISG
jgi:uncharacterized protein (TIGR02246 family)